MPTPSDMSDRPVFVDPSGRRRRVVRRIAIGACATLSVYAILLCAALSGAPIPPSALLPLPASPADTVTTTTADDQPGQQPHQAGGAVTTTRTAGVTRTAAPSLTQTTTQSVVVTTTATTTTSGNRNSHAPTAPPGRTKHTDTTAPIP